MTKLKMVTLVLLSLPFFTGCGTLPASGESSTRWPTLTISGETLCFDVENTKGAKVYVPGIPRCDGTNRWEIGEGR